MSKVSTAISNNFCPQALFLYGTYKDDGTPNFGLFCWFSYTWDNGLGVMACIGGEKMTKDLIRKNGVFSANLVTEELLPLADYYGSKEGYNKDKMNIVPKVIPGAILNVPVIEDSPWSYELKVKQEIHLDGSDVFLCEICNVLADQTYTEEVISLEERMKKAAPVVTTHQTYFSLFGKQLGSWGEPKNRLE
jgi:flavin reductase (DIM6/NTAB) family NADH-FMN oxidoreductase RutF